MYIPGNYHLQMYTEQHLVHSIHSLKYFSSQYQYRNTELNIHINNKHNVSDPLTIFNTS